MIAFDKSQCSNLAAVGSREWLETNGLGGFACSTIAGMNTRRYHGLLTAALHPPVGRVLLLSKLEETLVANGQRVDLCTNQYAGAVHPQGYRLLAGFRLDPFPIATFEWQGVRIEKTVFAVHDSNSTVIEYRLLEAPADVSLRLELRPLVAFRDYHALTHENGALNAGVRQDAGVASIAAYGDLPRLYLAHNAARVDAAGYWYRQFYYALEAERGLNAVEDLFNPLTLHFELSMSQPAAVIASTEPRNISDVTQLRASEIARRRAVAAATPLDDALARQLTVAADSFLVRRGDGYTILAGYPWFTDWGRDTMVAVPGLLHIRESAERIKNILRVWVGHMDQGMLPNRFPDAGEAPEYNTVDATLWFFEAVRAYFASTGDAHFIRDELYPALKNILDWHVRGTRYGIAMDGDGLLAAGVPGVPLTWMDARVGARAITPRTGKPVEIQALWFNALKIAEELAARFGDTQSAATYGTKAATASRSFNSIFWNQTAGCLYDVVGSDGPDPAVRPNQLFAISLHYSILGNGNPSSGTLSQKRAAGILEVVERELLTPYGLRSLSPNDPQYQGRYEGDPAHRDSAYHQGTVWPWLFGAYLTAVRRIRGDFAAKRARELLQPLEAGMREAGLGQVSEIYDGDAPHHPRGCFAQAWNIAELLRVLSEDIFSAKEA